jgi:iron-sulfur cluster assembly protein
MELAQNIPTQTDAPVHFTPQAAAEIRRLMQAQDLDASRWLRIGVKGGGCSGLSYVLSLDQKEDQDDIFETEGVRFVMNRAHAIYLDGMEIHWEGGLNARGFTFRNPNASKTCGCGSSFAV